MESKSEKDNGKAKAAGVNTPVKSDTESANKVLEEQLKSQGSRGSVLGRFLFIILVISLFVLAFLLPAILPTFGLSLAASYTDFFSVMLLGALVGFVEIISRYQDAPFRTAVSWPGLFYMVVNALVAASALWAIRLFGWTLLPTEGQAVSADITRWTQVIVAGLGGMAIFRSSLFVIGKGENEASIGPNAVLQILLNAIDKEVDRYRGQQRAASVKEIMENMHLEDAISDLPEISRALMQNLREQDAKMIESLREDIRILSGDPDLKKHILGLRIMDIVGEDILIQAINIRGRNYYAKKMDERIKKEEEDRAKEKPSVKGVLSKQRLESVKQQLQEKAPEPENENQLKSKDSEKKS